MYLSITSLTPKNPEQLSPHLIGLSSFRAESVSSLLNSTLQAVTPTSLCLFPWFASAYSLWDERVLFRTWWGRPLCDDAVVVSKVSGTKESKTPSYPRLVTASSPDGAAYACCLPPSESAQGSQKETPGSHRVNHPTINITSSLDLQRLGERKQTT